MSRRSVMTGILALAGCAIACAGPRPEPAGGSDPAEEEALLQNKATYFHRIIEDRHLTPEGLFLYRVDLGRIEEQLAGGRVPALSDTPTYTGLFAAMSCIRGRIETGGARAEALADADRALAGLELLMGVTGRPGLVARGVQGRELEHTSKPSHRWFPGGPGYERFDWRGDASHDQYANGLLPAIARCHADFPERTRRMIHDIASMLLESGMQLVDPDGRRTTYGDLSRHAGWGFNSIAKLTGYAVFALAAELDPDPRWLLQRDRLRDRDRMVSSSTITNLRFLGITNFSNDLMAWNLLSVLVPSARRTSDPALSDLEKAVRRAWERVRVDDNAYFAVLHCGLLPDECDGEKFWVAREMLLRFPLEKRRLELHPLLREIPRALLPGRKWHRRARRLVPIEIRPPDTFEWKSNPYRISSAVNPDTEYTGLDFLIAYWSYRGVVGQMDRESVDLRAHRGQEHLELGSSG